MSGFNRTVKDELLFFLLAVVVYPILLLAQALRYLNSPTVKTPRTFNSGVGRTIPGHELIRNGVQMDEPRYRERV